MNEKFMHSQFIEKICELDGQGELAALIWEQYAGPIQLLLENRYVFQPFWDQPMPPRCNATGKGALSRKAAWSSARWQRAKRPKC